MTDPRHGDPGPDPVDEPGLARVSERLARSRPRPRPEFVAALGRRLADDAGGSRRPGAAILAYGCCGSVLITVAALGAAGTGPLAP